MMRFLLIFLYFAESSTVPCFVSREEIQKFYERTEKYNASVRGYKGKGKGLMLKKNVKTGEIALCIGQELALMHLEISPVSEFSKGLNPIEKLAARVLFERFMGTPGDFHYIYANSLPDTVPSPLQWPEPSWDLLNKFSLFSSISLRLDLSSSYTKIHQSLQKIHKVNELMLKNETIDWAMRTVLSRHMTFIDPSKGEVHIMAPYLDLVNHWPSPEPSNFSSIIPKRDMICLISPFNRNSGEELLIDYGPLESYNFFFRYLMNPAQNPNDIIIFKYKNKGQVFSDYSLESSKINLKLLEALTLEVGHYVKIEKDFRNLLKKPLNAKKSGIILKSLISYRNHFTKFSNYSKFPGLRETRRYEAKSHTEELIMNFASSSRESLYIHLEAIDREVLYGLFYSILI